MKRIVAGPASSAEALIVRYAPARLLTLVSPDDAAPLVPFPDDRHLILRANDIVASRPGLVAPDAAMMTRLLDFARGWDGLAPLLVVCFAGVSRSTAAAYVIACLHAPAGTEVALAQMLRARAPTATPNALMVSLADTLLGRDGRMRAAIAAIGRGAETARGSPFTLDVD